MEKSPCGGNMMGHGCHGMKRCIMKKIVILVMMLIIFCLGYQLGEIKGMLRSEYGFRSPRMYQNNNDTEMKDIWNKMSDQINAERPTPSAQTNTQAPVPTTKK